MNGDVLIHINGPLPDPGRTVVGNGIRAAQLGEALARQGIRVGYLTDRRFYPDHPAPDGVRLFDCPASFREAVSHPRPDLLVCIQGEGLEWLDNLPEVPVLADWIAPRMLEFAFQGLSLETWLGRLTAALRRADYHSCCTPAQRAYLYAWLQLAGVDLSRVPVAVIPLAAHARPSPVPRTPEPDGPILVAGGIHWPWIRSERFLRLLVEEMETLGRGRLRLFGGRYPFPTDASRYNAPPADLTASRRVEMSGLVSYDQLLVAYESADAAIDLFEENAERHLALSFRELDYLKCGLPIVCAAWSHIAEYVRTGGAGWVLDDLSDQAVRDMFRRMLSPGGIPDGMRQAARSVLTHHFDPDRAIRPLLSLLGSVRPAPAAPSLIASALTWGEHARRELEHQAAELRALRAQVAGQESALHDWREIDHRKEADLRAAGATVSELRSYATARDEDIRRLSDLLTECQQYAQSKEDQLRQTANLLDENQRYSREKEEELRRTVDLLCECQRYAQDKEEELRRTANLLTECQRFVQDKEGELHVCRQQAKDTATQLRSATDRVAQLEREFRALRQLKDRLRAFPPARAVIRLLRRRR